MHRLLPLFGILLIIALVVGGMYILLAPELVEISPADGESNVRAGSSIRLKFSRSMQTDSIIERLSFEPPHSGKYEWKDNTLIFSPSQPWPNGKTITATLARGGKSDDLIPLTIRNDFEWTFSIGQPLLVYLFPADGSPDIYIYDTLSGESERLTQYGGVLDFDIDVGGRAIYFSQRSGQSGSRIYRLRLGDEVASEPQLLLDCTDAICQSASISPDSKFLAYERTFFEGKEQVTYPQVWLLPLTGEMAGEGEQPGNNANTPHRVANEFNQTIAPHWSPTGWLTYYDYGLEAFVVQDPISDEQKLIKNQTAQPGSWHPSGNYYVVPEIFFVDAENVDGSTDLDTIGSSHLLLFNLDNDTIKDLTQLNNLEDTVPIFSPDGRSLTFARKFLTIELWTPGRQLWLMDMDKREAHQLTNDPFYNHFDFAWSPTGEFIAYMRFNQTDLTSLPEIWVINPKTLQTTRLVEGGFSPQWIP